MDEKNIKFLTKLRSALEDDAITRAEFIASFKVVMEYIAKAEVKMSEKMDKKYDQLMASAERAVNEMRSATDSTFAQMRKRAMESITAMFAKMNVQGQMDKMYQEHEEMMGEMKAKMPDKEKMMGEMKAMIPAPTPPDTSEQVRDKLESIQDEEQKLAISAIAHLEDKLKELEKKAGAKTGTIGGFNYAAMGFHIVDDESPVGSGTAFTINNPPSPYSSFKLYRGGARQRITEDYTLSGTNLTLNVALVSGEILLCDYRV